VEEVALGAALKKAFPNLLFHRPLRLDGFTSAKIDRRPVKTPASVPQNVDKLANAMIAAVDPGRKGTPADMAIAIDDLELDNMDRPSAVADYFRQSVSRCVKNRWPSQKRQEKCLDIVRERCSFHLFVPMVEAYFFGDPAAPVRAGNLIPSKVSGKAIDVEQFIVANDSDYLKMPEGSVYWAIDSAKRPRHPKHYLEYLCDPKGDLGKKKGYRETRNGKKALKDIDWNSVFRNAHYVKFLRSLFEDISRRFDCRNPFEGDCADHTRYDGNGVVLRNL